MSKTLNGTVSTPRITRIAVAIAVVLAIGLAGWANRDRIARANQDGNEHAKQRGTQG
jgi:hypothetical protein